MLHTDKDTDVELMRTQMNDQKKQIEAHSRKIADLQQVRVRLERTLAAANAYIHAMTAVYF